MPTNRTRKKRQKRDHGVPSWARDLRDHGTIPAGGSDEFELYTAWLYFADNVPGLPAHWREKQRLVNEAKTERKADRPENVVPLRH